MLCRWAIALRWPITETGRSNVWTRYFARGHVPIVCGGTGLYINALTGKAGFLPLYRVILRCAASWPCMPKTEGKTGIICPVEDVGRSNRFTPSSQRSKARYTCAGSYDFNGKNPIQNKYNRLRKARMQTYRRCLIGLRWERKIAGAAHTGNALTA